MPAIAHIFFGMPVIVHIMLGMHANPCCVRPARPVAECIFLVGTAAPALEATPSAGAHLKAARNTTTAATAAWRAAEAGHDSRIAEKAHGPGVSVPSQT
jgi:hypothetical protein